MCNCELHSWVIVRNKLLDKYSLIESRLYSLEVEIDMKLCGYEYIGVFPGTATQAKEKLKSLNTTKWEVFVEGFLGLFRRER